MTNTQPDYYAILGVARDASADIIKKSYRELARKFHPDVNPSPEAAQKIKQINEAYAVLGDPERRSSYDTELLFQARTATARATASGQWTGDQDGPSRPLKWSGGKSTVRQSVNENTRVQHEFNGFGRIDPESLRNTATTQRSERRATVSTATNPATGTRGRSPKPAQESQKESRTGAQKGSASPFSNESGRLLEEARIEFVNRRYSQAEKLCREALAADRSNAEAYELLGDVALKLGNEEMAMEAYSYSIQLDPQNVTLQTNVDQFFGRGTPLYSHPVPKMARKKDGTEWSIDRLGREVVLNGVAAISLLIFLASVWCLHKFPGVAFVLDFTYTLIFLLMVIGVASGYLLSVYGGMRSQSRELYLSSDGRTAIPFRGTLALLSMIWSGLSLIAYLIVGTNNNCISHSALKAYALTMLLSIGLVAIYHPINDQGIRIGYSLITAAFAGNVLFPTILLGWHWGDRLRFRSFKR